VFHVTPPFVETYTVDVGLVTDTYTYVPLDDTDTDVKPYTLELLDTTDDQLKYDVGATVGTGVGLPAKYVGDSEGAGVGLPALYVGADVGTGVGDILYAIYKLVLVLPLTIDDKIDTYEPSLIDDTYIHVDVDDVDDVLDIDKLHVTPPSVDT